MMSTTDATSRDQRRPARQPKEAPQTQPPTASPSRQPYPLTEKQIENAVARGASKAMFLLYLQCLIGWAYLFVISGYSPF